MFTAALFTEAKTWNQSKCLWQMIGQRRRHGILLSHEKRWNTAICDNLDGSWEYPAKRNKSGRKRSTDFTYRWNIKWKATNEQTRQINKTFQTQTTLRWLPEGRGLGNSEGGRIYGNGRWDFGWWTHNTIYRWCIAEMHTWNLFNFINQCFPTKFSKNFLKYHIIKSGITLTITKVI